MSNSKELRNKINSLLTEMQNIAAGGFDAEKRSKFDAIAKDVDQLESDAQRMEVVEQRQEQRQSFTPSPRPTTNRSAFDVNIDSMSADEKRSRYSKAFRSYALNGRGGMTVQ